VLRKLLDTGDRESVRGHAQYLLKQNASLWRSVTSRWARAERKWSPFDGITRVNDRTRDALTWHRLTNRDRPYSLSALQRFSACPYQFPARRDLPASAGRTAAAAAAARPAHQGQPDPSHAGELLP
jgi:hypothetical protein